MDKTPEEIKKGLELIGCNDIEEFLKIADKGIDYDCHEAVAKDALAYIQQLEERNSKLEYTLLGVMHSVDKWLDVEPYDFDKDDGTVAATRASNAREIALKAIEKLQKELQHERDQIQYTIDAANVMKDEALKLESRLAQVERERDAAVAEIKRMEAKAEELRDMVNDVIHRELPSSYYLDFILQVDQICNYQFENEWRGVCEESTKEE